MSRKKRIFDIDLPDEDVATAPVAEAPARRGPMASAIAENAEALRERKSVADTIRDENDSLAHEYVALRDAGQVVEQIPLDDVHMSLLVRDRFKRVEDFDLIELVTSIRELGLSNPIRVLPRPDGEGYELVQGYRRLQAYQELKRQEGGEAWDRIPSLVLAEAPDTGGLYRRMVDENIIRKDLSFAEMAHIAQVYAADPGTKPTDLTEAVAELFQSAPYSKRSYIRYFAYVMDMIGSALAFPNEIPRALGVALARKLKDHPELGKRIKTELESWDNRSVKAELDILRRYAELGEFESEPPEPKPAAKRGPATGGKTKTTFHIGSSVGQVKCTAGVGRLDIKADRDFTSIERHRLEQAIASLIDGLG